MHPTLRGSRVILRPLCGGDAGDLLRHAGHPAIARYTTVPHPYTLKHARDFIASTGRERRATSAYALGITAEGRLVGMMTLAHVDRNNCSAEVGYWVSKQHWRRGYTREALLLILQFGFGSLGLERIYARVMHPNRASAALLEQAGFTSEGRLRREVFRHGRWYDDLRYSILRREWQRSRRILLSTRIAPQGSRAGQDRGQRRPAPL